MKIAAVRVTIFTASIRNSSSPDGDGVLVIRVHVGSVAGLRTVGTRDGATVERKNSHYERIKQISPVQPGGHVGLDELMRYIH